MLQSLLADLEVMRAFTRSSGRGGGGGGGSNLPLLSTSLPNVQWEDVGGLESTRTEIMDAVELPLKYPTSFEDSRRSGILFGCELSTRTVFFCFFTHNYKLMILTNKKAPGTGKTLVAKAVAGECGLPFLLVKGPELLGSYHKRRC